ncbi:MAG: uncharacterized protein A8A55_2079 [Amphiamblys sp. WSBS2006]|nr:MAG: uncharacterized protein A8A55_2079 [Amphiamblys sp. WSBS2006]
MECVLLYRRCTSGRVYARAKAAQRVSFYERKATYFFDDALEQPTDECVWYFMDGCHLCVQHIICDVVVFLFVERREERYLEDLKRISAAYKRHCKTPFYSLGGEIQHTALFEEQWGWR